MLREEGVLQGCKKSLIVLNGTSGGALRKTIGISHGTDVHDCTKMEGSVGGTWPVRSDRKRG